MEEPRGWDGWERVEMTAVEWRSRGWTPDGNVWVSELVGRDCQRSASGERVA